MCFYIYTCLYIHCSKKIKGTLKQHILDLNERNSLIKYFILYIVQCADSKITQKLSMKIKFINPWRSGFGVTLKIEVEKTHYRLIQL